MGVSLARIANYEDALDRCLPQGPWSAGPDFAWREPAQQWAAAVWDAADALGPAPLESEAVRRGLDLAARPVFVCGAHRSGTSLMRNLLDGHPALAVLPSEGTFLTQLERRFRGLAPREQAAEIGREWLRKLANPMSLPPFWLLGRSSARASPYVDFARAFGAWWPLLRERAGGRQGLWQLAAVALAYAGRFDAGESPDIARWVEHTPGNERFLSRLWTEFPEARVIHVVRRPDAALASHKAMIGERWRAGREVAGIYRNLARSYRIAFAQSRRAPPGRYRLVRYEDLVERPEEAARGVAEFLGIEPLPCLLEPTVSGRPAGANTSFGDGPSPDLTPLERELLAVLAGPAAARLGYDDAVPRSALGRALSLLARPRRTQT